MASSVRNPEPSSVNDVHRMLAQFAELNRRRLFGSPPLEVHEVEEWARVRGRLEAHFESQGSSPWRGLERRDSARLPTHLQLRFGGPQSSVVASVQNISQGGLFIVTRDPLEEGSLLQLALTDDEIGGLEVRARVTWRRQAPGAQGPAGMGVAFIALGPSQRRRIDHLIRRASRGSQ